MANVILVVVALALVGVLVKILLVLRQVHVLVNSRLTEALNDITALKKALVNERRVSERKKK